MLSRVKLPVLILSACLGGFTSSLAAGGYAMYVWKLGFDSTIPGCDAAKLVAWDPACLTHNWKFAQSREWLWDTANRPGREIDHLFVSDINLRRAFQTQKNCSDPEVLQIKEMLREGHGEVPGVAIYALFAINLEEVSEKAHVEFVAWYNSDCAGAPNARFDGFANNNEYWSVIKCDTSGTRRQDYLDNLQLSANYARNANLATHYSMGSEWNNCGKVVWRGIEKLPTEHMIDIFDSVDVQVATIYATTAANRALQAGYYDYASSYLPLPKPFYVDSRTNKPVAPCQNRGTCGGENGCVGGSNEGTNCTSNSQCAGTCAGWTSPGTCTNDNDCTCATTTHFPYCNESVDPLLDPRTDDYMMTQVFDQFSNNGIPAALPAIHFFRGVYSSGGDTAWPRHYSGPDFQGPITFANPANQDELTWPGQDGALFYDLARAGTPRFDDDDVVCPLLTTPMTSAEDHDQPLPSSVFFYLVRVREPVRGWGDASAGYLRSFSCP